MLVLHVVTLRFSDHTHRDKPWGDLLTAYNGTAITYDEVGNPNGYNDRTFTWEHGRQLASQTKGGVEWEYTYNNAGLRTKRSSDSKTYEYVYSGDKLVQMTITDHTTSPETVQLLEFSYDASGQPLTMTQDGTLYYYVLNVQGDVTGLIDGDGNLLICYLYEGFGEGYYTADTSNQTAALASTNPLGYRGYVLDIGTAIYYLQSRYYDPTLGRFINADALVSTGQGFVGNNMFAYCLNNPSTMADPTGQVAWGAVVCPVVFPEIFSDTGNTVYESEEDAAFAAGVAVRTLTNSDDCEYICGIYRLNCGGYTVGACFKGKHDSADPNDVTGESTGYSDRTLIAMVHSHPYCTGHFPNDFSMYDRNGNTTGDFAVAIEKGMPIYLAAPNGELKVLYEVFVQIWSGIYIRMPYVDTVRSGLPIDDSRFDCRK